MIYITGDCHGNFEHFNASIFPEQNEMTKADYIIICGDFGGVWNKDGESKMETMKPYRINHLSWWKEELPSEKEMDEGRMNLQRYDNKVDFIITHNLFRQHVF